jgi:DNA mismatch repair protein MutS2
VPAAQLRVVSGATAPRVSARVTTPEPETPSTEINLVGRRAQDAVAALGPFLDRAVRTGASEVRVVTGIGSGALRRAVQEFLASSPYCAKYRDADPQSGGAAVTVAELN